MLAKQAEIIKIAQDVQKEKDNKHLLTKKVKKITEFPVNSYVLIEYPNTAFGKKPPTKIDLQFMGPMRVVNYVGTVYTLQNLVTMVCSDFHVSRLREFHYDPAVTDPREVANSQLRFRDVDMIIKHKGKPAWKTTMQFLVKWTDSLNNPDSWEPYNVIRNNEKLHEYLRSKNKQLIKLIPERFREP